MSVRRVRGCVLRALCNARLPALRLCSARPLSPAAHSSRKNVKMSQPDQTQSFEMLVEFTKDDDPKARALAVMGLARTAGAAAFAPVVVALFDPVDEVRTTCAAALGVMNDERALEPLLEGVKDPCEQTSANCVWALGQIDAKRCLDAVLDLLADVSRPAHVRIAAATAIGERCEKPDSDIAAHVSVQERARRALLSVLEEEPGIDALRGASVWSLGHLPFDKQTVGTCIDLLEDASTWTVRYAIEALANFKALEALDPLEELADSPDEETARLAAQAIEAIHLH